MDLFAQIDLARREFNVLEHPFYQRWSAGTLTERELDVYARQYRHAVVALAQASLALARSASGTEHAPGLERHAAEESEHVGLWDQFAAAPAGTEALAETGSCVQAWTAGEDELERLAVLYAIEVGQPDIARTKLEGLVQRYGYSKEGPATEYFRLHATLDVEHAEQAKRLIERLTSENEQQACEQSERMVARARAALRGYWELLDGVERECATD